MTAPDSLKTVCFPATLMTTDGFKTHAAGHWSENFLAGSSI